MAKKPKKDKKHKPDFTDRIINLENRVDAIERQLAALNAIPNEPPKTG